jgi:hypothetical protein
MLDYDLMYFSGLLRDDFRGRNRAFLVTLMLYGTEAVRLRLKDLRSSGGGESARC